ncbi:MAG: cytochrome c biogenesis protein CcsA [Chitinispirillaceae bacterium]|nr:cytochrome c biogenesis protein CcsA [Chitinispirillaceae bacterium]
MHDDRRITLSLSLRRALPVLACVVTAISGCLFPLYSAAPSRTSSPFSVESLGFVMILENGRKKPLDTYARNKLLQFSGKRRIGKATALEWLSRLFFDPMRGDFDKVFLINNPDVAHTLGIAPQRSRRYSYAALSRAAEAIDRYYHSAGKTPAGQQSSFEKEIIRIYANLIEYRTLASAFGCMEPDDDFHIAAADSTVGLPDAVTDPQRAPSFLDMLRLNRFLAENMTRIHQLHPDSLSATDKAIVRITKKMYRVSDAIENSPPHLIPVVEQGKERWMSPWGLVGAHRSAAAGNPAMQAMVKIRIAYLRGDQSLFNDAVASFDNAVRSVRLTPPLPDPSLELLYNKINAFFIAKILLGFAALLALIALFSTCRAVPKASIVIIAAAWLLCSVGILLRMLIMHHPPITNLYETFIFVAWSMMIIGMVLEVMRIRPIGLLTASLAGFIFLHIAGRYAADGDTMGMLAAILNSGFWLTTHIITISLGYAGCMGAGFIGHVYLTQRLLFPQKTDLLRSASRAVYGVFAFGLLFAVIGTVTGGMWADQAWGRFWGWDPKENGALLIILWGLIVFHYRRTGGIDGIGLSIGAIVAAVLVMCTWIGVNLLGTGLHSYGFTALGAKMLLGYAGFEVLFLAVFGAGLWMCKRRGAGKTEARKARRRSTG